MMKVVYGEHNGKTVELLMLKEPSYIKWTLEKQNPYGKMAQVKRHIQHLVKIFDSKAFTGKQCNSRLCSKPVTKFTVCSQHIDDPYWWCDTCDPYQAGAEPRELQECAGYQSALLHVEIFCNKKANYNKIIKTISQAKGLPQRVGETQAKKFFHG